MAKRSKRGKVWPGSRASRSDKFALYQMSVQEPESQCKFFERVYKKEFGRPARLLREDFCGTAAVCCEWASRRRYHRAYGYDLDEPTLRWGEKHNLAKLSNGARERVTLNRRDVRDVTEPKADVISAENFSYFIFRTRPELLVYFEAARENLADEGLFVLDIMGGSEVIEESRKEERRLDGFRYVWEQQRFDPITSHCTFFIHFRFRDGSELHRAFRYDWRLWTIPEVRELLLEAGFKRVDVYWEGTDDDGEGDGVYRLRKSAESDPSWIAYVVGVK